MTAHKGKRRSIFADHPKTRTQDTRRTGRAISAKLRIIAHSNSNPVFAVVGNIFDFQMLCRERRLAELVVAIAKQYLRAEKRIRMTRKIDIHQIVVQFFLDEGLLNTHWGQTTGNTLSRIVLNVTERARRKLFSKS